MNKIEALLTNHIPKPKRALRSNFTKIIVTELNAHPEAAGNYTKLSRLRSRLLTRAGMLSLTAGTLLVGGTAMAIAVWPTPSVSKTTTQELPSGNHIVGYNLKNCNYFSGVADTSRKTNENVYYEIRQGSALTDHQLESTLQGICEENVSNNAISTIIKQLPNGLPRGGFSTEALTVEATSKDSITVSLDPHYNQSLFTIKPHLTYTKLSGSLLVYNEATKMAFANLRPGDTVKMVMQSSAGISSETSQNYNPQNHPEAITILAIVKVPALTNDPTTFYTGVATDFVRLDTCTTSPTGFCRAYDFVDNNTANAPGTAPPASPAHSHKP